MTERVIGSRYTEYSENEKGFVIRTIRKDGNDSYLAGVNGMFYGIMKFDTLEAAELYLADLQAVENKRNEQKRKRQIKRAEKIAAIKEYNERLEVMATA